MLSVFSNFASWLIYSVIGIEPQSKIGASLHFFVEDTTKIFFLIIVMIYFIAILRASLNIEKVRDYLSGKLKIIGYFIGECIWCSYAILLMFKHSRFSWLYICGNPRWYYNGISFDFTAC